MTPPRQTAQDALCPLCGELTVMASTPRGIVPLDANLPVWIAVDYDGSRTWHQMTGRMAMVEHGAVCRGKQA